MLDGSGGASELGRRLTPYPPNPDMANSCGGGANTDPNWGPIRATYQAGSEITVRFFFFFFSFPLYVCLFLQIFQIAWQTTEYHLSYPGVRIAIRYREIDNFSAPGNIYADGLDIGKNDGQYYNKIIISAIIAILTNKFRWNWMPPDNNKIGLQNQHPCCPPMDVAI